MLQPAELKHIAKLARLTLSDEEITTYTGQVGGVLEFFSQLHAVDTSTVSVIESVSDKGSVLREDHPHPSLPVHEVLREAPAVEGEYFRVPKILDT